MKCLSKLCDAAKKNDEQIAINALHEIVPTFITPEKFNKIHLLVGSVE